MTDKSFLRKRTCTWDGKTMTLEYSLTCDKITDYGVSVRIAESGEERTLRHISTDIHKAEKLLDAITENCVTPICLYEVVSDWLESMEG